jgi:hypothetical protein
MWPFSKKIPAIPFIEATCIVTIKDEHGNFEEVEQRAITLDLQEVGAVVEIVEKVEGKNLSRTNVYMKGEGASFVIDADYQTVKSALYQAKIMERSWQR